MKKILMYSLAIVLAFGFVSSKDKLVRIFLVGDSTMADKDQKSRPETGWGMVLPSYFNDDVVIENHARNGRSTRTFISEGRWDYLMGRVGKGDYVVIQFGHNDQSIKKADRYTSPADFKKNFEKFVDDVRAKGAIPILCTPVERRKFDKDSNFVDQHGVYPNIIRAVAKEKGTYLIDMQHESMDFLVGAGNEGSKQYFMHVKSGECEKYPDGKEDDTHFKPAGAMQMAKIFVDGVKRLNIEPLTKAMKPAENIKLQYTKQLPWLNKLKSNTNNNIDEGMAK